MWQEKELIAALAASKELIQTTNLVVDTLRLLCFRLQTWEQSLRQLNEKSATESIDLTGTLPFRPYQAGDLKPSVFTPIKVVHGKCYNHDVQGCVICWPQGNA